MKAARRSVLGRAPPPCSPCLGGLRHPQSPPLVSGPERPQDKGRRDLACSNESMQTKPQAWEAQSGPAGAAGQAAQLAFRAEPREQGARGAQGRCV